METIILLAVIIVLGYALGRIRICGLQLGASGVLLVALVFGHFGYELPSVIQNLGITCFTASVGFIAGPTFMQNFKKRAFAYISLGTVIVIAGSLLTVLMIKALKVPTPLAVGMMTGALTSTPGLAAALEATGDKMTSVGYGIAYPFGVVGVVLFVQLLPKLLKADMRREAESLAGGGEKSSAKAERKPASFRMDKSGLFPFGLALISGLLLAMVKIKLPGGGFFSFGSAGGPLITGLIFGNLTRIGKVDFTVPPTVLEHVRELGLVLFLAVAGISAGNGFLEVVAEYGVSLFLAGALITAVPMVLAYLLARKLFRMELLNSLGSICGGMTSTPALGALVDACDTGNVAAPYAATYPAALVLIVIASQLISRI